VAIAVALNILWAGGRLIWRSVQGLLDYSDPEVGREIRRKLDAICKETGVNYHGLRFRATGHRHLIEMHLLFPRATQLGEAHCAATIVEERLARELSLPSEVITHLESVEDHAEVHTHRHYTGKPE
jgi:divalent metal cation (Fe/Co/Zn/Cd) transporter